MKITPETKGKVWIRMCGKGLWLNKSIPKDVADMVLAVIFSMADRAEPRPSGAKGAK